ncbi:MAG: hypothetical protein QME79_12535 [Bacillota bacterium]|nr:hypothetical protein [Bacillota bacterium]
MAFSYNLATSVGKVRLRIPDKDEQAPLFQDEELQAFLDANGGDVYLAAAEALETVAGDPQRLQQYERGSVSVQPQLSFNLRERAKQLRLLSARQRGGIVVGTIERGDFYGESD